MASPRAELGGMPPRVGVTAQKFDRASEDEGTRMGESMAPTEAPPSNDLEFSSRVQRNQAWLQEPETQAALMSFALSIMQPVGSPGELMGQFARSVGAGLSAAGSVQTDEEENRRRAQKDQLELQEFDLRKRRLQLDEQQLQEELRTKGWTKRSIMINSSNPLNKNFELGIPAGSTAKVEVTYDKTGRILSADIEDVEAPKEATKSDLSRLLDEEKAARDAGDTARADAIRAKINKETQAPESDISQLDREIKTALDAGNVGLAADLARKKKNLARAGEAAPSELESMQAKRDEAVLAGDEVRAKEFQARIDKLTAPDNQPAESNLAKLQRERDAAIKAGDTQKAKELDAAIKKETTEAPEASSNIAKLQKERDAAKALGTPEGDQRAAELDLEIKTETAGEGNISKGQMPVADPSAPGGVRMMNIPGGVAEEEANAAAAAATSKKSRGMFMTAVARTNIDRAIRIIDQAPNPDLTVTGLGALSQFLPASEGKQLSGLVGSIKANLGFEQLQAMRDASPTGGALGPVSDFENEMLQSVLTKLDQFGKASYFRENLLYAKAAATAIADGKTFDIARRVENGDITPEEGFAMMEAVFQQEVTLDQQKTAIRNSLGEAGTAAPVEAIAPQTGGPSQRPVGNAPIASTQVGQVPGEQQGPPAPTPVDEIQQGLMQQYDELNAQFPDGLPEAKPDKDMTQEELDDWDFMSNEDRHLFLKLRRELKQEEREIDREMRRNKGPRGQVAPKPRKKRTKTASGTGNIDEGAPGRPLIKLFGD